MTPCSEDPLAFLPLHPMEFRILLALMDQPSHGYRIVKRIEERRDERAGTIYPANLYRRIRTLLDQGLIEETPPPPTEDDVDPRRTYFRLTRVGEGVARAEARRLRDLLVEARARGLPEPT